MLCYALLWTWVRFPPPPPINMKKVIIIVLLTLSILINSFSLRELVEKKGYSYNYDPYSNILTLKFSGHTFTFLPNTNIYYKGINIYHLTDNVIYKDNDFIIPDEFLEKWKRKAGIYDFEVVNKDEHYLLKVYSYEEINAEKKSDRLYKLVSGEVCNLKEDYYSLPNKGVDYIKIVDNKILIKFKYITDLNIQKQGDKTIEFFYTLKKEDNKKNISPIVTQKTGELNKKKICIIIDPGHGGKDPGAIGITGVREKKVVLSIGNKITRELKHKGYTVLMTRSTDVFIPLRSRTRYANKNNGSIFVSIHSNFSYNPRAKGFEIYYLSKSASDDEAREVAAYENKVIKLEKEQKKDMLGEIIWSMMSNEFENESIVLGGFVSKYLKTITPPNGRPLKHARFYVLYGATMPAILIEAGFLSNRIEEKRLNTSSYQNKLADKIADAIDVYITKNYRKFINE